MREGEDGSTVTVVGDNNITASGDLNIGLAEGKRKAPRALNALWAFIMLTAAGFIGRGVLSDVPVFDIDIGRSLAWSAVWAVILIAGYGLIQLWRSSRS